MVGFPPSRATLTSLLLLMVSACSTTPDRLMFSMPANGPDTPPTKTWPIPPEVPRYAYVGDLRGESNLHEDSTAKKSLMSRFFAALVGLGSDAIPPVDLLRPQHGVVDDAGGRIYVADPGHQAVFVFDETASEFYVWDESTLDIPFKSPISIALAEQNILVSDSEQGLIFVFNDQGRLLAEIGRNHLQRPTGVSYDPIRKQILVSDTDADRIKIFDLKGKLLGEIGKSGTGPGQFNHPTFLHYQEDRLYVTDSLNARLQIINRTDGSILTVGQRGLYVGNFSRPKGIAVDSDGNIYMTESYYDYLLIFNPDGDLLMAIGGSGQQPGEFSQPTGIWIDDRDRIFVSDMLNSRISIFQYLGGG